MILVDKGLVTVVGQSEIVFAELGVAIKAVYDKVEKIAGEEAASKLIAHIGRIALDPDYKEANMEEMR